MGRGAGRENANPPQPEMPATLEDADKFEKCKTSLNVSVMQIKTEIIPSLSSSRFYTVELNSIFGLNSSIQTSLTDELKR